MSNTTRVRSRLTFRSVEPLLVVIVLLLAAYLRLNHLGWTEFKLDEATLSRLALNLVRGAELPVTGMGSSTGIVNLPLSVWLMAIPYAVSSSPITATAFVAMLNVAAVAGCYALARRWLGTTTALIATLLFAAAPWAVIHARKIWAQNLLPPFVVLWAWTGWLAFAQRRPGALIGHALALAACIHLHYSSLWLAPVSAVWGIAFARRVQRRHALAAVAVFALSFAPFVVADAATGGENIGRLLELARQPSAIDGEAARLAWLMITGQEIHSLAGPEEFENYLASAPGGEAGFALTGALGLLVIAGMLLAMVDVVRAARRRSFDRQSAAAFMLVTWLALPIVLQTRHSLPLFTHYFIILYPAPFLLVGWVVSWLVDWPAGWLGSWLQWVRGAVILLVAVVAVAQTLQTLALQAFVATRATPGGFGVPVGMAARVADEAARVSRSMDDAEILVYGEGDNPHAHEGPAVLDVLLPPDIPRRFVDLALAGEVYPRRAPVMVIYSPAQLPLPNALIERSKLESAISLRAGEGEAQVRALPSLNDPSGRCGSSSPIAKWENGVALLSAHPPGDWQGAGGWLELCVEAVAPDGADVHWFNHIIGPDGQRRAQIDGVGFSSRFWRPGDVIVLRFGPFFLPPDAPAGRYTLRVGMYTWPAGVNVPRVGAEDGPPDGAAEVDLGRLVR